jgi:hypothetical protein
MPALLMLIIYWQMILLMKKPRIIPKYNQSLPNLIFSLTCMPVGEEVDFTDFGYQNTLPLHARSTASQVSPSGNLNVSLQFIW